jgi:hypothetical protein
MKKTTSLLSNLFLASLLFVGTPGADANEPVIKEAANLGFYCHMQFPEMRPDTLAWDQPVLDGTAGKIVDFYGSCDYDPTGADAVKAQRRIEMRGFYGDGD